MEARIVEDSDSNAGGEKADQKGWGQRTATKKQNREVTAMGRGRQSGGVAHYAGEGGKVPPAGGQEGLQSDTKDGG